MVHRNIKQKGLGVNMLPNTLITLFIPTAHVIGKTKEIPSSWAREINVRFLLNEQGDLYFFIA